MDRGEKLTGYILLIALLLPFPGKTQHEKDFAYYDARTYALYEARQWKELIPAAREAISRGFDYYYLRMRLGIAYYELAQYRNAVVQFSKAYAFNKSEKTVLEYWQASFLHAGQIDEAQIVGARKPDGNTFPIRPLNILGEGGFRSDAPNVAPDDQYYFMAGLRHSLGSRLSLNYLYQNLDQRFSVETIEIVGPGNGPPREIRRIRTQSIRQNQYYAGAVYTTLKGLKGGVGMHFIEVADTDTTGPLSENLFSAFLQKDFPYLSLFAEAGWSDFGDNDQQQIGLGLTIYPLANAKGYLSFSGLLKTETIPGSTGNEKENQHWLRGKAGLEILPLTWLEAKYEFGEIDHFSEFNGTLAYNILDRLKIRYGASLQYWIGGKHAIYLLFQIEEKLSVAEQTGYRQHGLFLSMNFNVGT